MPVQMYQLMLFLGPDFVRTSDVVTALDLSNTEAIAALLNGHMEGSLLRAGVKRDRWHEYVLHVYEFQHGRGAVGAPIMRWALPAVTP
jgi:hypothetical protein